MQIGYEQMPTRERERERERERNWTAEIKNLESHKSHYPLTKPHSQT
ncbi:MAG: hypothetical protein N7Q72_07065 [Spiroplasma sp. Tabriz.8]|nr:hypothetical protein [Spiroplasma sp. Tabriz.8]